MKTKDSQKSQKHCGRDVEIYRLCKVEGLSPLAIMEKFGISRVTLWRILTKFERENPQAAELMKRQGKDVTPEDYKRLCNPGRLQASSAGISPFEERA